MSDLADILASLSEENDTPKRELPKPKQWSEADKQRVLSVGLTRFELYHLIWETKYHLDLYRECEWSETQDALKALFPKLTKLWEETSSETWWCEIDKQKEPGT